MGVLLTACFALIFALAFAIGVARVAAGEAMPLVSPPERVLLNADTLASLASILLVVLALAMLPWPLHPAGQSSWVGRPLLLWVTVEGAFLAPLAVGLLAPVPGAARAVLREAQISGAGRLVLWFVVGSSLWASDSWTMAALPGRVMLAIAGLMAVAAAASLGPFMPDTSLAQAGAEEGLDATSRWWATLARHMRSGLALALLITSIVPGPAVVQSGLALVLAMAISVVGLLALRQVRLALPRFTLHMTLRWCLWRALPVALAGGIYLAFS